jgi:hypothetical protein
MTHQSHIVPSERTGLDELLRAFAKYVVLPNYDPVIFCTAVVVTSHMDGDPTWGSLVSPSSTAKTEIIRIFGDAVQEALDELTVGGLLAWGPKAKGATKQEPIGILARHPGHVCASIADLSTLLATSDHGARDQLFALLRRAYDGSVQRDISPGPLRWRGRLTLLAAVTPRIDSYSSHADALGPRWLYYRLATLQSTHRRESSRSSRLQADSIEAHRSRIRPIARAVIESAVDRLPMIEVSEQLGDHIDDAAEVASLGRATVERSGYGRREITGMPAIEGPARIAGQLHRLARGLLALGLDEQDAAAICRRAALDSMPPARRAALSALAPGEPLTSARIARLAGCDRKVARFALEELQSVGVVTYRGADQDGDDDEPTRTPKPWHLAGEDAELIGHLLLAPGETKRGNPTPQPPRIESTPRFVPPSDSATGAASDGTTCPDPDVDGTQTQFPSPAESERHPE